MRWLIRQLVPAKLRLTIRLWQRRQADRKNGLLPYFAQVGDPPIAAQVIYHLRQPIFQTSGSVAKVHNLRIAIDRIAQLLILPQQVFSFWDVIGPATAKNGFQQGRNIINGKLKADYGGGLCQMAGLLYHLGLIGGLDIVERHPHSLDLYQENERYAPLGADATVVFAYKDLRMRNPHPYPLWFRFQLGPDQLSGELFSSVGFSVCEVEFRRTQSSAQTTTVETWREQQGKQVLIDTVIYPKLKA